jgi:response regulator of citrate/malate metabolism
VIRVLVVEDEPVAAEAHRTYVDRTPGFSTVAVAGSGAQAMDALARTAVDLVLLDMNLPDTHGIELCRRIRAARVDVDVLAVTSARELTTVRAAAAHGVVGYLLKPFTYAALRDRLLAYADHRERLRGGGDAVGQEDVDRAIEGARPQRSAPLPKGMHRQTLDAVVAALRSGEGLSAAETAERMGASRITARRYLEYLAETGLATRAPRYGGTGRPETEYRWRSG